MANKRKIRVAVLFGGRSGEHEVSLLSAQSVVRALDPERFEAVLIGIDKSGQWHFADPQHFIEKSDTGKLPRLAAQWGLVQLGPSGGRSALQVIGSRHSLGEVDVVFPVLHGTFGEDGTIQGLLRLLDLPFVGPSVLASAVGMDKEVTKRLWRDAGLPIGRFRTGWRHRADEISYEELSRDLGSPFFLKPANAGSSIGVHKIKNGPELKAGLIDAFQYDHKVLFEEYVPGREIEVSVLGNENPVASLPGELIPSHDFYSYEAKYIDEQGARFEIPARLPEDVVRELQDVAVRAFQCLGCEGMARVDFFLSKGGQLFLNEVNTIPGFTAISMYPKMWEASGLGFTELINKLIELALARHQRDTQLKTEFTAISE